TNRYSNGSRIVAPRTSGGQGVAGSASRENLSLALALDGADALADRHVGGVADGPAQGRRLAALDRGRLRCEAIDRRSFQPGNGLGCLLRWWRGGGGGGNFFFGS